VITELLLICNVTPVQSSYLTMRFFYCKYPARLLFPHSHNVQISLLSIRMHSLRGGWYTNLTPFIRAQCFQDTEKILHNLFNFFIVVTDDTSNFFILCLCNSFLLLFIDITVDTNRSVFLEKFNLNIYLIFFMIINR
jgi:hypothetical protein